MNTKRRVSFKARRFNSHQHQNGTDMTEPKRPLKVFLCHASADKPAVRELYLRLTTPALAGGAREDAATPFVNGLPHGIADNNGRRPLKSVSP